ncbi:hypothetical protein CkaCkLH20_05666 [Colletotrichum karsti]|uniref:Solute carrier family 40 protein n=1 Tax=Colletotrichum karsti TaxID=1095194 RepID=A0A9P6IDR0_9PEZI|nr:uncharacterized protein CkaCkLH20_05666 [Colletotrichum karsti]KAF9876820.1 hypothetical protein CkaCkLH20_05666 [Colletotrichum karsti]
MPGNDLYDGEVEASPSSSASEGSYHDDPISEQLQPDGYRDEEAMTMAPQQQALPATPSISKPVIFRLYVSHFLSTWNSRLFEFGAVLFLASIYPGTLMPMSIYALVRGAVAVVLSPSIGSWIDRGNRLSVVRISIVGQRLAVAMSCGIFLVLERIRDLHGDVQNSLFAMVVSLACIEKLCSVMNLVSVERDWVVVITEGNEKARQELNARIRRIDLFCKLIGPLAISLIDGASTTIAIWVTLSMTLMSVVTEYLCIARVYQLVPALAQLRYQTPAPDDSTSNASVDSDASGTQRWTGRLKSKMQAVFPVSAIPFYFSHPALRPSLSLALLYFTVLSFSGQMITFLLSVGYNSFHIGIARTIGTVFELSATWAAPKLMDKIGPIRAGIWSLSWQMIWLAAGVSWFFADKSQNRSSSIEAVSGLVGGVILSRVGLWGYDLSAQTIIQGDVDEEHRGAFSTVEASMQSIFELLSYASTVVFSRPDQFQWPIVMSVGAIYLAGGLYASYVRKRRGHLFHAPPCLHFEVGLDDKSADKMTSSLRRVKTEVTSPTQEYNYSEDAAILRKNTDDGQFRGLPATRKTRWKILGKVLSRWAITMAVIVSIYVVVWVYSSKPVMSQKTKRQYNALITGLSIALGIAVASSLNHMVAELRWWILSRRYRSKSKVERILAADNLKHTIMLAVRSKRWTIHVAATGWLILSIGSQVGLAAVGLCYSTDTADKQALLVPGNVTISDMTTIGTGKVVKSNSKALGAQQYTANSYGIISQAYASADMSKVPSARAIYVASDPLMFCDDVYCKYVFHETSTSSIKDDDTNPMTVATNRSVNSTASCASWRVTSGGNGTTTNITVALENGGTQTIDIPYRGGTNQSTFMTNSEFDCGEGCSIVSVLEASDTAPWYYSCNVTVGQVANATRLEHELGMNLTDLAAAGIALQGYAVSSLLNDTNFQYQSYPAESVFGTPMEGNNGVMQVLLARFAIGVVAIAAENNADIILEGTMPLKGTKLNVSHWNMIHLILVLTASLQLTLGIAAAVIANRVVVPGEGAVEVAQVMRAMAIRERMANGDAGEKGSSGTKSNSLWIYRDTLVSKDDGIYDLHMEEQRFQPRDASGMIEMNQQLPISRQTTATK